MFTATLPDPKEMGGPVLTDSETHELIPENIDSLSKPPSNFLQVLNFQTEKVLVRVKKPSDVESLASGTSSDGSDFTSPKEASSPEIPERNAGEPQSETPVFNDNSEPPTLYAHFDMSRRKMEKTVSFAEFAEDLENDEVFKMTPKDCMSPRGYSALSSAESPPSGDEASPFTPSMRAMSPHSVRSVQSVGELPSTPSIDHIYLESQWEAKENFYTRQIRFAENNYIDPTRTSPQLRPTDLMYINSSPMDLDPLEVPASRSYGRSVGSLPASPILENLFLGAAEGVEISKESSCGYEPKPNVTWGMPESDTESNSDNAYSNRCSHSEDETETSSTGGDEFMTSKAWFTASVPQSPDSVMSYSFGGDEMTI